MQERLGVATVIGEDGNAQASRDRDVVPADREGGSEGNAQLLGNLNHVVVSQETRQQEGELVSFLARHRVALPEALFEDCCHAAEEVVADRPAASLVDRLETVEPQHHDR